MNPTADAHNPYLAARYVDNERYCSLTKSIRNWQLVGGALLLANIGLTSGLVYVTSRQHIAPYIVAVDAAGSAVAITHARQSDDVQVRNVEFYVNGVLVATEPVRMWPDGSSTSWAPRGRVVIT